MGAYTKYNHQLLNDFFKLCMEKSIGTFIVATEEHTCQFVIDQGVLISASYGQNKGLAALQAFKELESGHSKFSDGYKLRMNESAIIEDSDGALRFLGYTEYLEALAPAPIKKVSVRKVVEPPPVETVEPEPELEPERRIISMYRGQPVYEEIDASKTSEKIENNKVEESSVTQQHQPKKPVKMYRGQVVK